MKALSVRQPHAQLIVIGPKRIETRSWATKYRGRLLIHAGARRPKPRQVHDYDTIPPLVDAFGDPDSLGQPWEFWDAQDTQGVDGGAYSWTGHLGAIVGSCNLVDVVPIKHWSKVDKHHWPDEPWIEVSPSGGLRLWPHGGINYTDQLPYGDFTPGNYAWILEDAKPCEERCPVCCGEGGVIRNEGHPLIKGVGTWWKDDCATCNGKGICNPIPAKGSQGLWNWEPS